MSKRVLICDDAMFMRAVISNALTEGGYEVVGEAATGEEAVVQYQEHGPDLVTMDVVMPVVSGLDAIRQIKEIDDGARILVCSAMGQEGLVREAMDAGALGFVVKPFTAEKLTTELHRVATATCPS